MDLFRKDNKYTFYPHFMWIDLLLWRIKSHWHKKSTQTIWLFKKYPYICTPVLGNRDKNKQQKKFNNIRSWKEHFSHHNVKEETNTVLESAWVLLTADAYWHPVEQKAENALPYLTKAVTKNNIISAGDCWCPEPASGLQTSHRTWKGLRLRKKNDCVVRGLSTTFSAMVLLSFCIPFVWFFFHLHSNRLHPRRF